MKINNLSFKYFLENLIFPHHTQLVTPGESRGFYLTFHRGCNQFENNHSKGFNPCLNGSTSLYLNSGLSALRMSYLNSGGVL